MPTQLEIDKRRALAKALLAQQMPQGQQTGRFYTAPSGWAQALSGITNAIGQYQGLKADSEQGALDKDNQRKIAEALAMQGTDPATQAAVSALPPQQQGALLGQITASKLAPKSPQNLEKIDTGDAIELRNPATGQVVQRIPKGVDPALKKSELKDAGGSLVPFDPYAPPAEPISKTVTPDANLSSATTRAGYRNTADIAAANRATTERGQDLSSSTAAERQQIQSAKTANRDTASLRKEFRGLPSVKEYETSLPIIESARGAPDTPAGDLQVIYSVGKVLDPNSVVREGELQLTQNATPFLQKIMGKARAELSGEGRLTPQTRANLVEMLDQRVEGYKQAYSRDYDTYGGYARDIGADAGQIVGTRPETAFSAGGSPPVNTPASASLAGNGAAPEVPRLEASPAAVEALKANPQMAEQFKAKFGYLPPGF